MKYECKLMASGRNQEYLCFYIPKELVSKHKLKKGQRLVITDNDNIILSLKQNE